MLMVGSALTSIVDPLYYKVRRIAQIVQVFGTLAQFCL